MNRFKQGYADSFKPKPDRKANRGGVWKIFTGKNKEENEERAEAMEKSFKKDKKEGKLDDVLDLVKQTNKQTKSDD